jgi:Carboxypeptidase regulatory-like domain
MRLNRWIVVPGVIALTVLLWNIYVATHGSGVVEGRVVDAAGAPVAGATAHLWVLNFTTFDEKAQATTDAQGRFRFASNESHSIQLSAEKSGVGTAPRRPVRLWFRAQEVHLAEPLVLKPAR